MKIKYDRKVSLGQGGFGSVFRGKYKGREVAVKRVQMHLVNVNEEKALQCLQQLGHPDIVKLFYSESDDNIKYFALELCAVSLDQLCPYPQNYKGFKLPHHLTVIFQLASGLAYIHSNGLFHRDIKPANVLIFIDSTTGLVTIKWADFGLSKFVNERGTCTLSGIKGTEYYLAPELVRSLEKNENPGRGTIKSDVFAFALVIGYLLLDGQHLYGSVYVDIVINIKNKSPVNMGKIDPSHYVRDLLTKMLKAEPGERMSSIQVVNELKDIKIEVVKKEEEFRELFKNKDLDLNEIKLLIKNGIDVNVKSNYGTNALNWLCFYDSSEKIVDAMRILIQNGIDVNGKDDYQGSNALHSLCRFNSSEKLIDAMQFLIQNGIDVNEKNKYGWNALHILCRYNSSEKIFDAMYFLIKNGIDVNGKNNDGTNALHFLCGFNSSEKIVDAMRILIQNGIDVNGRDVDGWNALHFLCRLNSIEKLIDGNEKTKFLIKNGIDVNEKDKDGWKFFDYLSEDNSSDKIVDAIRFLIQNGIDVNEKNKYGWNALHILCRFNSSEKTLIAMQFLIENGIDVNATDNDGQNALHFLCWKNSSEKLIDAIKLLIQNGIDVNGKDNDGTNALHFLCRFNSSEKIIIAIQLLIEHGIQYDEIHVRLKCGRNPYLRNTETIEEIIQLLDRHKPPIAD